jgi:translation initiation factor 5A
MVKKNANQLKKGNYFISPEDNEPYLVQDNEHSKSGKHGHAKSRITCVGLFTTKKKQFLFTADEQIDIPEILKKNGQLVDIDPEKKLVHVMDVETYETYEVAYPLDDSETVSLNKLEQLSNNKDLLGESQVEFWDVLGRKFVTRVIINQ